MAKPDVGSSTERRHYNDVVLQWLDGKDWDLLDMLLNELHPDCLGCELEQNAMARYYEPDFPEPRTTLELLATIQLVRAYLEEAKPGAYERIMRHEH